MKVRERERNIGKRGECRLNKREKWGEIIN